MLVAANLSAGHARPVFEGVSFELQKGEFVGLLGPNGAGKSTLLKTLSGLLSPRAGRVELAGKPLAGMKVRELARQMAVLPQQPPNDGAFTVHDVVALGRHPYQQGWGWGNTEADARAVAAAMQAVGLPEAWNERRMSNLSGGEQQRVRLAQALAQEPQILLLDEPTAWADLNYQLELMRLLAAIARDKRIAVMAVLHDLNQASQFCSRLLLLHEGRLVGDGTPQEILTEEAIARAYGVRVHVQYHPETGAPYLLPRLDS